MKEDIIFNQIYDFENLSSIKDARKYLNILLENYPKLNEEQKQGYIFKLKGLCLYTIDIDTLFDRWGYRVLSGKKAIQDLMSSQFIGLNQDNFTDKIKELQDVLDEFTDTQKTKIIKKPEITTVFNTICEKFPNFENILHNVCIEILILRETNKNYNSLCYPDSDFIGFKILCLYMKDDKEYKDGTTNPIYVLLHELGHVINWYITKEKKKVPDSFFKVVGKHNTSLKPENPLALEVFADSFAMAVMHNTELDKYNPFNNIIDEEVFIGLENYFQNIFNNI